MKNNNETPPLGPRNFRREFLGQTFGILAVGAASTMVPAPFRSKPEFEFLQEADRPTPEVRGRLPKFETKLRITKLETMLVKPRWIFLKIHTDEGVYGWGEPLLEGRALTIATAIKEIEPYLIGQDPRHIMHHWQAIYRHAFYRGGPILTSALSGIDQALWDIKGKLLGVPVYELLGGPTRDRVEVYARAGNPQQIARLRDEGWQSFKTGPYNSIQAGYVASPKWINEAVERFAALREAGGPGVNIGIDFHGAIQPQTAKILVKALEPYQPYFIEEPVQCQNVDVMAEIAKSTHIPIATGERLFTKWAFREVLEKGAASILQPDICHCGGIMEARLIAAQAEAYYACIAPHNPMGPISLASGIHLAASIPNFLCQEQVSLGEGILKEPYVVENGHIALPTKPGLGIDVDIDLMRDTDRLGHNWMNPQSYLEKDGSVADW
jgi:galactonate dehydratase